MNRYRGLIGGVWSLAVLVTAASVVAWSTAVPAVASESATPPKEGRIGVPLSPTPDTNDLGTSAMSIRNHDPFRFDRKQAAMRFSPDGPVNQPGATPPSVPPRPGLRLVGIIGGPPWTALVEGLPGREGGVLVRVGEETGGIRLTAVHGDTVVFTGLDTIWVLRVRPAWQ